MVGLPGFGCGQAAPEAVARGSGGELQFCSCVAVSIGLNMFFEIAVKGFNYALPQIVVNKIVFFEILRLKNLDFLRFLWTLDGLERSGRPVGTISTNFRQKRSSGFRAMTKNLPKFTTINTLSIKV